MSLNIESLTQACKEARGLSIDAVAAAKSGHLGLPLGATELGAVLYGYALNFDPAHPKWLNRDRFILSAGHGSMFLYSWLHLAGFDLPLEALQQFRQLHSITPGHPEFGETPGVESTTGPLGQGVGNAVGYAVSAKMAAATFNTLEHTLFDYHVVCLAGDGCLQEGVASEASSFAACQKLDNLILFYDSNDVTLDAMAAKTQSEDTAARYRAYGFEVTVLEDGHDMLAILAAYDAAKAADNGKPKLIVLKTEIGRGIPEVAGTEKAHGEGGVQYAAAARKGLGLPDSPFYVSDATRQYFKEHAIQQAAKFAAWETTFKAWETSQPEKAALLRRGMAGQHGTVTELLEKIPSFATDKTMATRAAGGIVLQPISSACPLVISGSADLHSSTKNYLKDAGDFSPENRKGRNFYFGIREHAMGAILNGIAYDGLFKPSGATFLTFADYMRPAIRLAALAELPVVYIFTHDSVGVGEDGPTHQPVELVCALRAIPNLDVIRPADPEETAAAFASAFARQDGPTALILTRQNVPHLSTAGISERRAGTLNGAYILKQETGPLELILIASGSEVQHALAAANDLGTGTRVVSMPSMELFDRQPHAYRAQVLPASCRKRISMEAGVGQAWHKYVGLEGNCISIERFGISAPGEIVMQELGMDAKKIVTIAKSL